MLTFRIDSNFYDTARQAIRGAEGFRADIYADSVKIPTIGYGYAMLVKGASGYTRNTKLEADFATLGITITQSDIPTR